MAHAKPGDTVKIHYTGSLENGTIFDSSIDHDPIQFTIGTGLIITGLEQAVVGLRPGERTTIRVPAEQAHGPHREELVMQVDRGQIPADPEPHAGQLYDIRKGDEATTEYRVTDVTSTHVTLDANHPLAGHELIFEVQLLEIV
jgi:peptidylprolyl isomerase